MGAGAVGSATEPVRDEGEAGPAGEVSPEPGGAPPRFDAETPLGYLVPPCVSASRFMASFITAMTARATAGNRGGAATLGAAGQCTSTTAGLVSLDQDDDQLVGRGDRPRRPGLAEALEVKADLVASCVGVSNGVDSLGRRSGNDSRLLGICGDCWPARSELAHQSAA
jgi:hypothetical protein